MAYEWQQLTARLEWVLAELSRRDTDSVLILADSREAGCFVQFLCGAEVGAVWAEVADDKRLPADRKYADAAKAQLAAAGWDKPGGFWSRNRGPNWSTSRTLDGDPGVWRELAEMAVAALRDVQRIDHPGLLVYDAFVQTTGEPLTFDQLELTRAPSSND